MGRGLRLFQRHLEEALHELKKEGMPVNESVQQGLFFGHHFLSEHGLFEALVLSDFLERLFELLPSKTYIYKRVPQVTDSTWAV